MNATTAVTIFLIATIPEISIVKRRLNKHSNSATSLSLHLSHLVISDTMRGYSRNGKAYIPHPSGEESGQGCQLNNLN